MISPDIVMHAGDRMPTLQLQLNDGLGNPVDLTGAAVTVHIKGLTKSFDGSGSATGDENGNVLYEWGSGQLNTPGFFGITVEAVWGVDEQQTFPEVPYVLQVRS
jgi:hypothetical protein